MGATRGIACGGDPHGARENAKARGAIFLGTRPASDSHFFARLLAEADASVYKQVHAAGPDDPPFAATTWRKANPALGYGLPDIETFARPRRALRSATLPSWRRFRSLRLNQGTSEVESRMLIDSLTWRAVETETLPPREGSCAFGVDLGGTAAFSACAAYWPRTGRLEGFVSCGVDPELSQRALADGVSGVYEAMRDAGELVQLGGRVVPVGPFLAEAVRRYGRPQAIAADRWRAGELEGRRARGPACRCRSRHGAAKVGATARKTFAASVLPFWKAGLPRQSAWQCGRPLPRPRLSPIARQNEKAGEGRRRPAPSQGPRRSCRRNRPGGCRGRAARGVTAATPATAIRAGRPRHHHVFLNARPRASSSAPAGRRCSGSASLGIACSAAEAG